jgi:hypothetical protein
MTYTRREFTRAALAGSAASALGGTGFLTALAQGRPNSLIDGVQIGTITYSYRSMPDQSAEAVLRYVVESGISAIELMGGPVESFAGAPVGGGRGGGGAAAPAGAAGRAGRGRAGTANAAPAELPPGATRGSWRGVECVIPAPGAARGGGGGGRGRGQASPEQQAAQQEQAAKLRAWRTSASM